MKIPVSFLHTSPAAIPPLMAYYGEHAPEFEITNQLDDGLLRLLSQGNHETVEHRLRQMLATARDVYKARVAMVTCSSVPVPMVEALAGGIPVLKIDTPMAESAVNAGSRLGVLMSFRPTLEPTSRLLEGAAKKAGKTVELVPALVTEAYDALLGGNPARHDELLLAKLNELNASDVDGIVLAQVSMARLIPMIPTGKPVFSSLPSSLSRIRETLR